MPRTSRVLVLVFALAFGGCGDDATRTVGPDGVPDAVTIDADQILEIRLDANPTTGFEWVVEEEGVLKPLNASHEPESDADGSPGITTLAFEPAATGTGNLVLAYRQPWEEGIDPARRYEITVTVAP